MLPPALIVSVLLGSVAAMVFFLLQRGGKRPSLWVFWLVGIAGFLGGQIIGEYVRLVWFSLGDVHVVEGLVTSVLALFLANRARL